MDRPVLVTGFMPYAGRGVNPAAEIAKALDGRVVAGAPVVARLLPVSFAEIADVAVALIGELDPRVVVNIGLWPGEPLIRIERVALNVADFEIPDNRGQLASDDPVHGNGAVAIATLPVRTIEQALLEAGIPARMSNTAGTYLCNACLYTLLTRRKRCASEPPRFHPCALPAGPGGGAARSLGGRRSGAHQRGDRPRWSWQRIAPWGRYGLAIREGS